MFLKKKEKDPNWDNRKEWKWNLDGPQNRPALNLTSKNYIGGLDPHITIQDPSRHARIIPSIHGQTIKDKVNLEHERRRQRFLSEAQRNNKTGLRKVIKGLGDKLFGKW
jgi:hypothetical protein